MKAIIIVGLLALTFTTGFTCSKNAPPAAPTDTAPAPTDAAPAAPAPEAAPTTTH